MKFTRLPYRNLSAYRRFYRLTALAVVISVGIITGSLMVGDSVRANLVRRVTERLKGTETVVFSRGSYLDEALAGRMPGGNSRGLLLVRGFVSSGGRLIPVTVLGVDDMDVARGTALVNPTLAEEIGASNGLFGTTDDFGDIVLRLPSGGVVPSGSLFVTKNYTTSLRLSYGGIVDADEGGNISLRNEQTLPFNIFVQRSELAENLGVPGKINLILSPTIISDNDFSTLWTPASSGLVVRHTGERLFELTSDRIFLQEAVVENVSNRSDSPDRLFSYLVNTIRADGASIPYSFATALDSFEGKTLASGEAILSDYAARRLGAREGDGITLTWFRSGDLKTISTDSITLRVGRIVPLEALEADGSLSADFPGLSDVERCTDWDSDLPLDMSLITDEDERYWERHRNTPKILIPYGDVAHSWGNEYGTATSIRMADPDLSGVTHAMTGIEVMYPRETAMAAATGGVDFSSLFLALGCFIVTSAMVLMTLPLVEMLRRRRREFETMFALGFTPNRVVRMVWRESTPLVLAASGVGALAGILYTGIVMRLLGGLWRGATHTGGFEVEVGIVTFAAGFAAGAAIALVFVRNTIRRVLKESKKESAKKSASRRGATRRQRIFAVAATISVAAIIAANLLLFDSVAFFVITGALFIVAAGFWGNLLVSTAADGNRRSEAPMSRSALAPIAIRTDAGQAIRSLVVLSAGVFTVFSVGLNRRSFADPVAIITGTGGYALWGESSVPLYHNLSTNEGRRAFSLGDMPADTRFLQLLRYEADDASCLNLNRVSEPTVLGVDMSTLAGSDFKISESLSGVGSFEAFAARKGEAYPALVDATVLEWSLGKRLGDTLWYRSGGGERVAIVLAGKLANSVFQGNILIDRSLFSEIWPETAGSEVFLAASTTAATADDIDAIKNHLSRALAEYGVRISTTAERLREFNSVTDTYLSIFFTLGCLGLLLGIAGFVVTVRRNLASRGDEIRLMLALGFTGESTARLLFRENVMVPLYAVAIGIAGALLGVVGNFAGPGLWTWLCAALMTVLFVICIVWFVRKLSIKEVDNARTRTNNLFGINIVLR